MKTEVSQVGSKWEVRIIGIRSDVYGRYDSETEARRIAKALNGAG
jgi:hypothetical protein